MINFIVSSQTLLKKLQQISSVIPSSNSIPILDNFLFKLTPHHLSITASDLETTINSSLEVETESTYALTIEAKILVEMLKTFTDQPLTFNFDESELILEIVSEQGNYKLAYFTADDYPRTPSLEGVIPVKLGADTLLAVLNNTLFATGSDDLRPAMKGVLFHFQEDKAIFVATDAHRLVKYSREDIHTIQPVEVIFPKKPLQIIRNLLSDHSNIIIELELNASNGKFTINQTEIICQLINGKYPNYDSVIPKETNKTLTVNKNLLVNAIKRISLFSNKSTQHVKFNLTHNQLEILAENIEFNNKANEKLVCTYQGDDLVIGFNGKILLEVLNNIHSDDILIELSEPNRPGIIKPVEGLTAGESLIMITMPIIVF